MKVKLSNFRCYASATFDLGESGTVLISGASGKGKTTLFLAIQFALFGTGNKLAMHGKKSCSVELTLDDMTIVRKKVPNHLLVLVKDESYENDVAQSIIDKSFSPSFAQTAYIAQNGVNSFVMMSASDKLAFLEKYAFEGVDLIALKDKLKIEMAKVNESLISVSSELSTLESMIAKYPPIKQVQRPSYVSQDHAKLLTTLESQRANVTKVEKKLAIEKKGLARTVQEKEDVRVRDEKMSGLLERKNELEKKISLVPLDKPVNEEELALYQEGLVAIKAMRDLATAKSRLVDEKLRLSQQKKYEDDKRAEEILAVTNKLWKEYSAEEVDSYITDIQGCIPDAEKTRDLRVTIADLEKRLSGMDVTALTEQLASQKAELAQLEEAYSASELAKKSMKCPGCQTCLHVMNSQLCIVHNSIVQSVDTQRLKSLRELTTKTSESLPVMRDMHTRLLKARQDLSVLVDKYEEPISSPSDLIKEREAIIAYKKTQLALEERLEGLKVMTYSDVVKALEKSVQTLTQNVVSIEAKLKKTPANLDEDAIRNKVGVLTKMKEENERNAQLRLSLNTERELLMEKINSLCSVQVRGMDAIQTEITLRTEEIRTLEEKIVKYTQRVKEMEEYERYLTEKQRYEDMLAKQSNSIEREKELRDSMSALLVLKDKINVAESLAILNVLDCINTHVEGYLTDFFPDHPIMARLESIKETKAGADKTQVHIHVEYKGSEVDISSLSGGELSRVILAYTLALGEVFHSKVMLLDECTASLDAELTNVVVDSIKQRCSAKLVVVIAHQTVSGMYDRSIEV